MGSEIFNTLGYKQFKSTLDNLLDAIKSIGSAKNKKEQMRMDIYTQLVVHDFFSNDAEPLSYDEMRIKADEATEAYFKEKC